ncbi:iron-only hydrogenase maturation protein HydG [Candidatus Koribacter versatilis Ellin345]|uniref:Iron-only hydrogenase maturation protein HydG n=1 Tax=Koribacter versatilis (strain Ellin345) TaxID=204669 RepID=Q1IMZ6_KORVE|nr:[FeFe] hydrogenase H-cluster radical SAM maturase HydG [Candidatus Koribacter versatilis]ABF41754.1 iron-only hydrogenase maturation protein HydG [Candidatus Koribacter versatilis Ellin345]
MNIKSVADFIKEREIEQALKLAARADRSMVQDCIQKAVSMQALTLREVAVLMCADGDLREELYEAARFVKNEIYGSRLVLFAPLYISNLCTNECSYCAFRKDNKEVRRRWLSQEEIAQETRILINQGYKRTLLVAGEAYPKNDFNYVLESIATIYATKSAKGEIRRVHANVAPPTVEQFYQLREAKLGVYQCFQESYHRPTYAAVHKAGKKADYDWRAAVMHRAMASGVGDVGMGVLYGLYDWRWETLALMQHIRDLERTFGAGSHTISVPRIEPAVGSKLATRPPNAVTDDDFLKIIAVLRLAVPYTGLVMSTREPAEIRRKSLEIGISQMSAGSRTDPGGYSESTIDKDAGQFVVGDHRPLDEIVKEVAEMGFIPSFCTACYRVGRTGSDFKNLASHPHVMSRNCETNALTTLLEYLCDYSVSNRVAGEHMIEMQLEKMAPTQRAFVTQMLNRIKRGERDVFV